MEITYHQSSCGQPSVTVKSVINIGLGSKYKYKKNLKKFDTQLNVKTFGSRNTKCLIKTTVRITLFGIKKVFQEFFNNRNWFIGETLSRCTNANGHTLTSKPFKLNKESIVNREIIQRIFENEQIVHCQHTKSFFIFVSIVFEDSFIFVFS